MSSIYDIATWIYSPLGGFRTGEQWMVKPLTGAGRVGVTRATNSSRIAKSGLIETVGSGIPAIDWIDGKPYTGVWGSSTNLLQYSEQFDNAAWIKGANTTITANAGVSPDGNTTADRIQLPASTAGTNMYQSAVLTATNHTNSIWIKKYPGSTDANVRIGASTTVVALNDTNSNLYTATDEWVRVDYDFLATATTWLFVIDGNASEGLDILIWGAQLETGSFASPYIPTTGATATRNADSLVASNASSVIGQTSGSIYFETYLSRIPSLGETLLTYAESTSATDSRLKIYTGTSSNVRIEARLDSGTSADSGASGLSSSLLQLGLNKGILTYDGTDLNVYLNGSLAGTLAYTHGFNDLSQIYFAMDNTSSNLLNGHLGDIWATDTVFTATQANTLTA